MEIDRLFLKAIWIVVYTLFMIGGISLARMTPDPVIKICCIMMIGMVGWCLGMWIYYKGRYALRRTELKHESYHGYKPRSSRY